MALCARRIIDIAYAPYKGKKTGCHSYISAEKRKKKERLFLLQMIANSKIDRPRRPRRNPRAVKVKMSNFKRKRSTDKSECTNFMQDVEILYQEAA